MEEREGGKGNRVYGKNEESIRRGRSSFEKDTGRNKKICG